MTHQVAVVGSFCWNELATSDLAACKQFYQALFGWEAEDQPMPEGAPGVYTIFKLNGVDIAGGFQMEGEMFQGVPPHWGAYVSVDDVDATMQRAVAAGGTVMMPAMDVPCVGRMGGFQDPQGAHVRAYKGGEKEDRPDLGDAVGFLCWNELATSDAGKAAEFYSKVFGWGIDKKDGGPMPYTEFQQDGKSVAGMIQLDPSMGDVPTYWAVYVSVEDCDATLAKAIELGAKVLAPAMNVPEVGRFSCFMDPTGAVISVISLVEGHC